MPLRELARPLGLSLVIAVGLFFVFRAVLKDAPKAGLIVSLLALWFLSYGHAAGQVAALTGGLFMRSFFWATVLLVALITFLIVRSRRDPGTATRILNVAAAVLVLFNVASVVRTLVPRTSIGHDEEIKVTGHSGPRPDIYFIVLDAYTRADILREVYSFDNSDFLKALESRGFFVASRSYANYPWTYHSLAATLNMTYLDDVARRIGDSSFNQEPLYKMILENRVMAFLKERGYEIVCFSSSLRPGDVKHADQCLGFEGSTTEFQSALLNTTPLPLFQGLKAGWSAYGAHRSHILDAFRVLEESPRRNGPFFFFVHVMSPHPPFVFGPDGEPVEPDYLYSLVDADQVHGGNDAAVRDYIARYRDQLAFINKRVLATVEAILRRSPEPPIIVLQGDHGSRAYAHLNMPEACYIKENLAFLNAFYLPGNDRPLISPDISPVNTFRLVFNHYFGAELDLLEDESFWCSWRHPYRFSPFDEASYQATIDSVKAATRPVAPAVQKR